MTTTTSAPPTIWSMAMRKKANTERHCVCWLGDGATVLAKLSTSVTSSYSYVSMIRQVVYLTKHGCRVWC